MHGLITTRGSLEFLKCSPLKVAVGYVCMEGELNHSDVGVKVFLLTGARGVNFLLFALPLMGSFFYWLYAVGYKLFTSHPIGGLQGKWKTRNLRDIHLEYPVFDRKLWKAARGISCK